MIYGGFKLGKIYRFVGSCGYPSWDENMRMVLDNEPRVCNAGSGSLAIFRGINGGAHDWEKGLMFWQEVTEEEPAIFKEGKYYEYFGLKVCWPNWNPKMMFVCDDAPHLCIYSKGLIAAFADDQKEWCWQDGIQFWKESEQKPKEEPKELATNIFLVTKRKISRGD